MRVHFSWGQQADFGDTEPTIQLADARQCVPSRAHRPGVDDRTPPTFGQSRQLLTSTHSRFQATARVQTGGEEIANAASHAVGFFLAVAALPALLGLSQPRKGAAVGTAIFCATMMLLYVASTFYHACPQGRTKEWLNRVDQAAIFLFIAGSYTPFAIDSLAGGLNCVVFGLVWTMALLGTVLKLSGHLTHAPMSTAVYVATGWVAVVAAAPFAAQVSRAAPQWLLAGGAFYTVGVLAFMLHDRVRYAHCVWHLLVIGGCACHFIAVGLHLA